MTKKKILIINTGGTISSVRTDKGYVPQKGYVETYLSKCHSLLHPEMPEYFLKEYDPLLDSSNMTVMHWNKIGKDIEVNYNNFDGFVIFHGTDTMAYTASALSFMLESLGKPVILTGSQIPLCEARNDAFENIMTSLWFAANKNLNEVCIYFNQRLLRGNRAQKISSEHLQAFDSPNFPHLNIREELSLNNKGKRFFLQQLKPQFIANFRIFPGFSSSVLKDLLLQPLLRALILETYGTGNAPCNDLEFLDILHQASLRGIILVNHTQCTHGSVEMSQYATGNSLKAAGLISARNMTAEAAHCKLLYLLSKYEDIKLIKSKIETSLRGELG